MPSLDDDLIYKRVDYLLQQIFKNLDVVGQIDGYEVKDWWPFEEDFAVDKRFATKWLQLADGNRIMLCEEYDMVEYLEFKFKADSLSQLKIEIDRKEKNEIRQNKNKH
jgi:hypothetical protein